MIKKKRKEPETDGFTPRSGAKRPRPDGKLRCKSGISVKSDITFALEKESSSFFPVLQFLVTSASVIAVIFMLQSFFIDRKREFPIVNADSVCLTIMMTALSALMICRGKMFFKLAGLAYLGLNVVYIFSNSSSAAMGFMYTANAYSKAAELPYYFFEVQMKQFTEQDLGTFLISAAFVLTLLTSVACIFYVNFPILFLVTFPFFELGAYHGWAPAPWTVAVMVVCWVTVLSISLINHSARRASKSNFAVSVKRRAFYLTSPDIKSRFFSTHALTVIAASTAAFMAAFIFTAVKGNYRPESFTKLRRDITRRFGEVTTDLANGDIGAPKIPGRNSMIGGTNGGQQLGSSNKIEFSGKVSMRISCDEFTRPLYLRGYAGEDYTERSGRYNWDPIRTDNKVKEAFGDYLTLDYNFLQNYGMSTVQDYYLPKIESSVMRIAPVNCQPDTFYAPYGTYYSDCELLKDQKQPYDGMISPKSQRQSYSVNIAALDSDMNWDVVLSYAEYCSKNVDYPRDFESYSSFVASREEFTYVPDDLKPLLEEFISSAGITPGADDISLVKAQLRNCFANSGFVYSIEPGVVPENEDFIKYFLSGGTGKKGHCQFYASAAVMLMRELGYPARYVEGYLVEPDQFVNEKTWLTVTDRCAHAWCEVYIPGLGWQPIELTPGYEGAGNPNLTDQDRNIKPDDSSEDSTENSSEMPSEDSSSKAKKTDKSSSSKEADTSTGSKAPKHVPGANSGGNGGGEGGDGGDAEGGGGIGGRTAYFIMMVLFIVGFAAALVVRRRHILDSIDRSIHDSSEAKSVISCYTSLLKYISLLGIKNDPSLTDVQLSSKIRSRLGVISPELNSIFMEISEPAITAYMSGTESDRQTADKSRRLLKAAQVNIFGRLNFFEKLSARWISGLY